MTRHQQQTGLTNTTIHYWQMRLWPHTAHLGCLATTTATKATGKNPSEQEKTFTEKYKQNC